MSERHTEIVGLGAGAQSVEAPRSPLLSRPSLKRVVYLGADLFALVSAHMIAVRVIRQFLYLPVTIQNPSQYHLYYIPFFAAVLYFFEGYKSPELRRPERELELGCKAVFASFIGLMILNFLVFHGQVISRYLMITWFGLSCVLLVTARSTLRFVYSRSWRAGLVRRRAVLLGPRSLWLDFERLLSIQRHKGYELLGLISEDTRPDHNSSDPSNLIVLGSLNDWERIIANLKPDVLIMPFPSSASQEELLTRMIRRSRDLGVELELYSHALANSELNFERDEFCGCLRFQSRPWWSISVQRFLKGVFDFGIGLVGSAVTLPMVLILGLFIKWNDGGPIFYRSAYLGQDRRVRYYLKFRTMSVDADRVLEEDPNLKAEFAIRHKLEQDPRVTSLGRFLRKSSLDEFPQFFSVLIGDLSFVGPRTIRQGEAYRYGAGLNRLLSVKPGMTGFWQVMGRQTTTYEERVEMDMFYIEHWSVWLDVVLIGKTFWKVLKCEGAY
jgi:exopolysaccharide biosynthesis polyprenyl glycosylphosphotransferase